MKDGNIIAIGRGDKHEIVKDVPPKEIEGLCAKHAPEYGYQVRSLHARIDAVRKEVLPDPDLVGEYTQFAMKSAKQDRLLSDDLAGRSPEEIEKRVEQYHKYLGLGSLLLFEHTGYRGSTRFFTVTMPNFKWVCFNDKGSSAVAWGVNVLFQHSWYGGRRLYLIGFARFPDLKVFDFNDMASSYAGF
jgi:hypothetical protein